MSYYLLRIGNIAAGLIFLLICLRLVVLLLKCSRKMMLVDLAGAWKPDIVRGKVFVVFMAVMFTIFLGCLFVLGNRHRASITISLTYPEASAGLNPNGSRYNMSDILSDEVLEQAITFGGFSGITAEELRESLDLTPAGDAGIITTQFVLRFNGTQETNQLKGSEVVYSVAAAYRNWFINQYSVNYSVLDISFDDQEEYDYPDMRGYLENTIKAVNSFADAYKEKNRTFTATSGETFGSLSAKGWNIYNTGMESLDSYILSKGLSKKPDAYISKLRYDYTRLCNSYKNAIQAYEVRIEAIRKYDNDMATVVYIPTYDTDNTFYMSKTKIGIDHFSADADTYSSQASETLSDIMDNKYLLNQIRANSASDESRAKADEIIDSLKQQILNLASATKTAVQEYVDSTSNGYISLTDPVSGSLREYGRIAGVGILFGVLLYLNRGLSQLNRKLRLGRDGERG